MEAVMRAHDPQMGYSCLAFRSAFDRLLPTPTLNYWRKVEIEEEIERYDQETKTRLPSIKRTIKVKRFRHEGEEDREKWLHWATTFCGYIQNKERGKKDSRAIASPNIITRMFPHPLKSFTWL